VVIAQAMTGPRLRILARLILCRLALLPTSPHFPPERLGNPRVVLVGDDVMYAGQTRTGTFHS